MLLRSSSTPVLGSLLPSSFSESPNHQSEKHTPNPIHGKIPCTNNGRPPHSIKKSIFHSPSPAETKTTPGFRRVQSEGNLEELANPTTYNIDGFTLSNPKKPSRKPTLEAIPSFSFHHLRTGHEDSDDNDGENSEYDEENKEFDFEDNYNPMRTKKLVSEHVNGYGSSSFEDEGKMYLATGLGVSGISFFDGGSVGGHGGGGGGSYSLVGFDRDGGDISIEEYYKKMLEGNPGNALFLRNYAHFLYQKGDLKKAEEYYSRAILVDPTDGEILSQYAKLIWELHHDKERAGNYFKRAVQASTEDSHVHAAYASFLWDTEDEDDDEEEENAAENFLVGHQLCRHGFMASATA